MDPSHYHDSNFSVLAAYSHDIGERLTMNQEKKLTPHARKESMMKPKTENIEHYYVEWIIYHFLMMKISNDHHHHDKR